MMACWILPSLEALEAVPVVATETGEPRPAGARNIGKSTRAWQVPGLLDADDRGPQFLGDADEDSVGAAFGPLRYRDSPLFGPSSLLLSYMGNC